MGQFINTVESKFIFVKGEVTNEEPSEGYVKCGEGTKYPMLVSPDELSAIGYRVRDCRIGTKPEDVFSYDAQDSALGAHNYEVKSNNVDTGAFFVEAIFDFDGNYETNRSERAVYAKVPPGPPSPYYPLASLSAHYASGYSVDGDDTTYYDLLEEEHHAWWAVPDPSTDPSRTGKPLFRVASAMNIFVKSTDFSQTSQHGLTVIDNYPSSPGVDGQVTVFVEIGTKVAYVNTDPDAGPFDVGSELYLELSADIEVLSNGDEFFDDFSWMYVSTDRDNTNISLGGLPTEETKKSSAFLVLRLTGGSQPIEVKCPFYMAIFVSGGTGFESDCWGQMTVEATKWYTYDLGDGNPAWDDMTGKSL